jgi:hypothetical protein
MKTKFTGGKWKIGNNGWCVVTDDKDAIDLEKRDSPESLRYYGGALICESCKIDDAKLITAAKDLYDACAEFVRKVECGEARSKRSYAQMKAAIKKATE